MHLINMTLFDLSQSRVYAALHRECCHAISISTCYLLLFTYFLGYRSFLLLW